MPRQSASRFPELENLNEHLGMNGDITRRPLRDLLFFRSKQDNVRLRRASGPSRPSFSGPSTWMSGYDLVKARVEATSSSRGKRGMSRMGCNRCYYRTHRCCHIRPHPRPAPAAGSLGALTTPRARHGHCRIDR
eukprot:1186776-Prorocentrum_minimum.AAC.7